MGECKVLFTSMAVVMFLSGVAHAELLASTHDVSATWLKGGVEIWERIPPDTPSIIMMTVESEPMFDMQASQSAYSTFNVVLTAENNTAFDWTGYLLELDDAGEATFIDGSGTCDKFGCCALLNLYCIEFSGPGEVAIGESAEFVFDLLIPSGEPVTFTLTQTPIPEPAGMLLLALGGIAVIRKRSRP